MRVVRIQAGIITSPLRSPVGFPRQIRSDKQTERDKIELMSRNRFSPDRGFCNPSELPKGPNGRALCRRCGTEVPPSRRTFCGQPCIEEWKLRTDASFVRQKVAERDSEICALCGLRTRKLRRVLERILHRIRHGTGISRGRKHDVSPSRDILLRRRLERFRMHYPWAFQKSDQMSLSVSSFWQADHIIPVVEGGGECGLDNYRTLCTGCHQRVTKELRIRLRRVR